MKKHLFFILAISLLSACNSEQPGSTAQKPIAFEKSDECHVCGMIITKFSGPKGQAFDTRNQQVKKFCSTTELIFWYLQPENQTNIQELYVHDMANTHWDKPSDAQLISARDAFYVIHSKKQGSMGNTLASFLNVNNATQFSQEFGGEIVTFNGLTLDLLTQKSPLK
ncbi:nitrous oxide reductase accessory protein NosL [Aliikangiella sp. IMCC44359]|uniref:nitrous oxide reductase accessory protein NosL n=1 Tax=Aliikangiella sp. IMCC44359 TaxID=3459125 RepID=UPI00403A9046